MKAAALALVVTLPMAAYGGAIPLPAEVSPGSGYFNLDSTTRMRVPPRDRDARDAVRYLVGLWTRTNRLRVPVTVGTDSAGLDGAGTIEFRRQSGFGAEGYRIDVTPQRIIVNASSSAGLFYGAVTLWQLLPPGDRTGRIPVQTIRDAPLYEWRGLMLDSARHFQSPAFIRSMIDWMAWHKLNVLHWHLTDDQGWRIEIRRFPRLTSVGAWRTEPGGERYGGFYTQAEIRRIVNYAAARHVQIVPEIDMPGHATAAIAAYPVLGTGSPTGVRVSADWGIHTHLFNLEPATLRFLDDVLAEVMELFPGSYIHIGGDEVVKDEWKASPEIRARARHLGMADPDDLQAYFTQTMGRFLAAHGRRIIGWDEILRPGLRKDAVVMSWRGVSGAHTAAAGGNDTILAPDPALYFDHRQSTLPGEPPGRLQVVSLADVYGFEPYDASLSESQRRHVLGIQANLWTEHMRTEERVEWMALPRAAAMAEVAWTPAARRSWPEFLERLVPMFARYRAFGLNYADSVFAPAAEITRAAGGFTVRLSNQAQQDPGFRDAIRYALGGSDPSVRSARYEVPLNLPAGSEIGAADFFASAPASRTRSLRLDADADAPLRLDSIELEQCSNGIGLLLEPPGVAGDNSGRARSPIAIDIMNPCWIDRSVDLSAGPRLIAAVAPLPFNYEIGADAAKIRVGDARTAEGELEVHVDGCETPPLAWLPLAAAARSRAVTTLPAIALPRIAGRHDLCLRFARPRLDPQWALDWLEIGK